MSTDRGCVYKIAFRAEGGRDKTEDFRGEAVDGGEAVLEIPHGHPNRLSPSCHLVNLEVTKIESLVCGDKTACYTLFSLKRKVSGLDASSMRWVG